MRMCAAYIWLKIGICISSSSEHVTELSGYTNAGESVDEANK
jgi:hypothetical protein